jgi:2-dehydropantoate 2-reductase
LNLTICGGGSLGLAYANLMAPSFAPNLFVRSQGQADSLNEDGITANLLGETIHSPAKAYANANILADSDIVICLVKYPDTQELGQILKASIPESTTVLSLQTGIRPLLDYRNLLGSDRVVGGVSYLGAKRTGNATVELGANLRTALGLNDVASDHARRIRELVESLSSTRLQFEISDNIQLVIWQKLVIACSQNAVSGLTGATFRKLRETAGWRNTLKQIIAEVVAVAKASGVDLPPDQLERVFANWESLPNHKASTFTDLQLHRLTEVDALNGSIVQVGRQHQVPTPLNELLTDLIHMAETDN